MEGTKMQQCTQTSHCRHYVFTALGPVSGIKIDIKGAFMQTRMKGEPVYMKKDPKIIMIRDKLAPKVGRDVGGGWMPVHVATQSNVWMHPG
jgi:hypothetical protein